MARPRNNNSNSKSKPGHTSLNTNITRTDNNAHELSQLIPHLDTQFKAIHQQFDHTNTDIEYNNKFNRPQKDSTSEPPTVPPQIAKIEDRLTATTVSEKEFRKINSVSLTNINTTIKFVDSQLLTTKQSIQQSVEEFEHRTLDRIATSMAEIGQVTNKAEQTFVHLTRTSKTPPPTTPSQNTYDKHNRALAKAEKTILTQDINIKHINSFHVDLEGTVHRQRDIINTLSRKIDTLDQQQKSTGNLESRLTILESFTAENISQAPPDIVVDTNSATQNTTSSLLSSHNDPGTSTRNSKRRKKTIPDP